MILAASSVSTTLDSKLMSSAATRSRKSDTKVQQRWKIFIGVTVVWLGRPGVLVVFVIYMKSITVEYSTALNHFAAINLLNIMNL